MAFSLITQPVAIQSTFDMSFLDNFSLWNKLDTKNQRAKKKSLLDIRLFYQ